METHDVGRAQRSLCVPDNLSVKGCSWVGRPLFCSKPSFLSLANSLEQPVPGGCPKGSLHVADNNMPPGDPDDTAPKECYPGTWSAFVSHSLQKSAMAYRNPQFSNHTTGDDSAARRLKPSTKRDCAMNSTLGLSSLPEVLRDPSESWPRPTRLCAEGTLSRGRRWTHYLVCGDFQETATTSEPEMCKTYLGPRSSLISAQVRQMILTMPTTSQPTVDARRRQRRPAL